jgi:hypothetical protein
VYDNHEWSGTASLSRPRQPRSTVLTEAEEAMFRRRTLLLLDDVLGCLRKPIPALSRSALHRCLVRHGISRLPQDEEKPSKRKRFAETAIGHVHIDACELRLAEGKLYMFLAIGAGPPERASCRRRRRQLHLAGFAPHGADSSAIGRRSHTSPRPQTPPAISVSVRFSWVKRPSLLNMPATADPIERPQRQAAVFGYCRRAGLLPRWAERIVSTVQVCRLAFIQTPRPAGTAAPANR